MRTHEFHRKSGFGGGRNLKHPLGFSTEPPGQSCPQDCPSGGGSNGGPVGDLLGDPLTIGQVAMLIGCSAWTVRQKYITTGLPHFRSGPNGKLIFYKNQIIDWLLERQRKGGMKA
jgi:hypothetical protein